MSQGWQRDAVGLCFEGSGNPELDVHHCSLAVEGGGLAGNSLSTLHTKRGRALVTMARYAHAKADFERALELNPLSAEAHHGRGLAHHAEADYAAAIRSFDAALQLSPTFAEALRSRGTARLFRGDLAGAIRDYNAELRRVPLDEISRILRGLAHYAAGEDACAATDLADAGEYPYRVLPLWLYLARARSGADGRTALIDARDELDPAAWPAALFDFYLGDGDALAVLSAIEEMPASLQAARTVEAHLFLGELARLRGDAAAAKRHLTAATEGAPSVEWALAKALLARSSH